MGRVTENEGMMMKQKLLDLFVRWKEAHKCDNRTQETCPKGMSENREFVESFIPDGCVDYERYMQANCKVLFLLKEPASLRDDFYIGKEEPKDLIETHWFKNLVEMGDNNEDRKKIYYKKFKIIADCLDVNLSGTAFMNINKRGGYKEGTNEEKLVSYIEVFEKYIKEEIDILKPNIIISCIGNGTAKETLFNIQERVSIEIGTKQRKSSYVGVYSDNIIVYGMEHPGSTLGYKKYEQYFNMVYGVR